MYEESWLAMAYRYDVAVVGAGVMGCMVARELARYQLDVVVLERAADVCEGSSKANSGLIHTGFHAREGSLKGLSTVEGNRLYTQIVQELEVPYKRIGALYCAFGPNGIERMQQKHARALANGAGDLPIISGDEARVLEPRLSKDVLCAMVAESTGIISPFALVVACAENACSNGVQFVFNAKVERIEHLRGCWNLYTTSGARYDARFVVNTAGDNAALLDAQVCPSELSISPRRGQYYVFDKQGSFGAAGAAGASGVPLPIRHVLFQSQENGEGGTLLCPTVDGNLLAGPTSENVRDFKCAGTTAAGLEHVRRVAQKIIPDIQLGRVITSFAGVRANITNVEKEKKDFVLRMTDHGFVSALGIKNPGMTCAPALARRIVVMLGDEGLRLEENTAFNPYRARRTPFLECSADQQKALLQQDSSFGHVICRCENITEGDVRRELSGVLPPSDFEGVKHRLRTGMGRCQGGFCKHRVQALFQEEGSLQGGDVQQGGAPQGGDVQHGGTPHGSAVQQSGVAPQEEIASAVASASFVRTYHVTDMAGDTYVFGGSRQSYDPALAELKEVDVLVIGGGAAGISAAVAARQCGAQVLLVEREEFLGGVLPQCIHDGFGMYLYHENLTGPGFLQKWLKQLNDADVQWACASNVVEIHASKGAGCAGIADVDADSADTSAGSAGATKVPHGFDVKVVGAPFGGARTIHAKSIVVASGCREVTRGQLRIPGTRPEGIYTAGTAQYMVNIEHKLPGNKVVILGGGDIGLIMARRMTLAGAQVRMVVAKEATGLARNHRRCIEPYHIPVRYGWGVASIHGNGTLKGVMIAPFNEDGSYDMSKREYVRCNTLLISCGLVPEQELFALVRNAPGLFVCGNADKVHDLVDRVCIEGIQTGAAAAHFAGATGKLDCTLEAMAQQEIKELPIMQERLDRQNSAGNKSKQRSKNSKANKTKQRNKTALHEMNNSKNKK